MYACMYVRMYITFVLIEPVSYFVYNFRLSLSVNSQSSVFIEFHCLLSIERWGFDNSSEVSIYFGHDNLLCGPMSRIKRFVVIIKCKMYMPGICTIYVTLSSLSMI